MRYYIRSLLIIVGLAALACLFIVSWLRGPVIGRTKDGTEFELRGRDAILHCVMTNDAESLQRVLLIDRYDLDASGASGTWTFLQLALQHQCYETTEILLKNKADPNHAPTGTPLPIELAKRSGSPEIVELLLKYGAGDAP